MKKSNLRIGNILRVSTTKTTHYEIVISIEPEILTQDISSDELEDTSIQGICENWKYKIVSNSEIVRALEKLDSTKN